MQCLTQQRAFSPTRICILRLSAIGDVCHAVATVQAIQRKWPKAKITWIIGDVEAKLIAGLKGVEFITLDKSAGVRGLLQLRKMLRNRYFDVLLHMQTALRASITSCCIPAAQKLGFDRARAKEGQWLFTNCAIAPQEHPHVADGFFAFARAIGVQESDVVWQAPTCDVLDELVSQVGSKGRFMVIAPCASKRERNWTAQGYAAVADYSVNCGLNVVLAAGPSTCDCAFVGEIEQKMQKSAINVAGKTSLPQLLALIARAKFLVGPDSGPVHMAGMVNTPVVGLYAHSNPRRTGPYLYQKYVVNHYDQNIQQQKGRSWKELPWGARAKGQDLMALIKEDEVLGQVKALVQDFYQDQLQDGVFPPSCP